MKVRFAYLPYEDLPECRLYNCSKKKALASNLKVVHILDTRYNFSKGSEWEAGFFTQALTITQLNNKLKQSIDNPLVLSFDYHILPIQHKFIIYHPRGGTYEILNITRQAKHILYKRHNYKTLLKSLL